MPSTITPYAKGQHVQLRGSLDGRWGLSATYMHARPAQGGHVVRLDADRLPLHVSDKNLRPVAE